MLLDKIEERQMLPMRSEAVKNTVTEEIVIAAEAVSIPGGMHA